jgi:hypothetical protein
MPIRELDADTLRDLVAEQIQDLRGRLDARTSPTQLAIDRAAIVAWEDGELHVASGLLLLSAFRVAHKEALADQALLQLAIDLKTGKLPNV